MHVSIQEFKSHLSRYVSDAQSGLLIELTSHRKVVAKVIGVPPSDVTGVSRLLASGAATWQGGKPIGASLKLNEYHKLVSAMVLEDRR
jgi:antitoxin (DNA-binding transcriptional repressor) of toxin-antitoxin stability system